MTSEFSFIRGTHEAPAEQNGDGHPPHSFAIKNQLMLNIER